jgi:ferric-dicitrate binding protein FerR (iron transport regulator)
MNRSNNNEIPNISDIRLLDIDTDAEWNKFRTAAGIKGRTFKMSTLWKVAASIVIIAGASLIAYTTNSTPKAESFSTTENTIEAQVETSTTISLNRNSSIVCTDNRNNGKFGVKLKGEAYFDVEKNPNRTFEIYTQDLTITVRGTSFDVCESTENTSVTVTSGNVEVTCTNNGKKITGLTKGKQFTLRKDGTTEVKDVNDFNNIAWKLHKLDFRDQPLSEIMQQLQKTYGFCYKFVKPSTAQKTMTVSFENQELQQIFSVIEQTLDITIAQQPDGTWHIEEE